MTIRPFSSPVQGNSRQDKLAWPKIEHPYTHKFWMSILFKRVVEKKVKLMKEICQRLKNESMNKSDTNEQMIMNVAY